MQAWDHRDNAPTTTRQENHHDHPHPDGEASTTDSKPAAVTQTPKPAPGWDDNWSRPSAWAAFGSDTNKDQQ